MVCAINKIDSNITSLAFAEEVCFKQLPVIGIDGFDPTWYSLQPNSYSDFGGQVSMVARAPIDPSRQNRKGTITDLTASGNFNHDLTQNGLTRLLQGFFFANARQPLSTQPLLGTQVPFISTTSGSKTYAAASGLGTFAVSDLVKASGFGSASNNGLKTIVTAAAGAVTVAEMVVTEASPPATAKMERVGLQFASADINIAVTAGIPSLVSTATNFVTSLPDLIPGKWIYLGDDNLANRFANNVGYARVKTIAQNAITFDDTTWTAVNETGTGKTISIYFGTTIRNENTPSLIKRRSYSIERQLGLGASSAQAEYLEGAVPNEMTLHIPTSDKLNIDLTFIAASNTQRSGDVGDLIKTGTRISLIDEEAFNSTSNVYRMKLGVLSTTSSNNASLFGFSTEATLTVKNNVSPSKAIGVLGAFDTNVGNFEVGGSVTAYFATVAAVKAVRQNADVGYNIIAASKNAGFIFDIPLLGLGGGRATVAKDQAIMLPLESSGAKNSLGYTLQYDNFAYLPSLAMPA